MKIVSDNRSMDSLVTSYRNAATSSIRSYDITRLTAIACLIILQLSSAAHGAVVKFTDEFSVDAESFGIGTGTLTWRTNVELIVPKTELAVGEIGSFTILGNVSNSATGLTGALVNVATIFGKPADITTINVEEAQPFKSLIRVTSPKIFVGPSNPWGVRAYDQVSTETTNFTGTIAGVGASYTSTVQGAAVADWFELIGESNQLVRLENRVLSASEHGKFTGSGASFRIDGFFQDTAVGTGVLSFSSRANYTSYGTFAPPLFTDYLLGTTDINLQIPIKSVPEPSMMVIGTLFGLGGLIAKARMKKRSI